MGYKLMLKQARQRRGLSQEDMASLLSMSVSTYRSWEQGVSQLTLEKVFKICDVLGTDPNELAGWYEDHPKPQAEDLSQDESELLDNFRSADDQWKQNLSMTARAAVSAK